MTLLLFSKHNFFIIYFCCSVWPFVRKSPILLARRGLRLQCFVSVCVRERGLYYVFMQAFIDPISIQSFSIQSSWLSLCFLFFLFTISSNGDRPKSQHTLEVLISQFGSVSSFLHSTRFLFSRFSKFICSLLYNNRRHEGTTLARFTDLVYAFFPLLIAIIQTQFDKETLNFAHRS